MEHPPRKNRSKINLDHKKGQNTKKKLLVIGFLVLGALLIYHPIKNFALSKMIRYETAQWKVLEQSVPEEAVMIRAEKLIAAPADGEFEPIVLEGEKVAVGRTIGYVKTRAGTDKVDSVKVPVKASMAGLVSYHPDGLEDILKPDLLNSLDLDKISDLLADKKETSFNSSQVEGGKAFCKIVDNLINPFLYLQYSNEAVGTIEKGQEMTVRFTDAITSRVIIRDVKKGNNQFVILAEVLGAPDLDLEKRFVQVNVISHHYEGVTVLAEALVKENGQDGVFVSKKGVCTWIKVEVKGYVGTEAVVTGLDVGSQYIVNSSLVHEGQRIY
ncbi:MAG: HlyD family efflux transporter periplasmic adaptor subunit [Dehalobacterium sp.]